MATLEVKTAVETGLGTVRNEAATFPLWEVFCWELGRLLRQRFNWLAAGCEMGFTALAMWQLKVPGRLENPLTQTTAFVDINSPWGLLLVIPYPLLFLFGVTIPFIFAPLISRDVRLRTHELLMVTPVPGLAFVMGRYLAGLVVSWGIAILLLWTLLVTGAALQQWEGQPPVPVGPAVALWAIFVLPTLLLLSGLAAGLAAWKPKRTALVIAFILVAWCLAGQFFKLPPYETPWYAYTDPTGSMMGAVLDRQYRDTFFSATLLVTRNDIARKEASQVEQEMPDLWPWLPPQAVFSVIGFAFVGIAGWRFKRFSNCLN